MKKILSIFLTACLVITSGLAVLATDDYTEQYLDEGFTRLNLTNTTFGANVARTFSVNIREASEYTVFIGKTTADSKSYTYDVTFTKDGKTLTLMSATESVNAGYGYIYSRIGATNLSASPSVALEEGVWTLSIKASADIEVSYIDVRRTIIPIDGTKQAIYPSDYNSLTAAGGANYINNDINKTYSDNARIADYDYFADYTNSSLATKFSHARSIHFHNTGTLVYKVDVKTPGTYKIGVKGQYYYKDTSKLTSTLTDYFMMTVGNTASIKKIVEFEANSAATQAITTEYFIVNLAAGVQSIEFKMQEQKAHNYIHGLTFEKTEVTPDNAEFCLVSDGVDEYVKAAHTAYQTEEYADYTTSIAENYVLTDVPTPVTLAWLEIDGATSYTLYVSENNAFPESDTLKFENIESTDYSVYNLYPGKCYYWYVVGNNGVLSDTKSFTTQSGTIRQIYAEGGLNIRDIGGWNGLNPGMAYRGAEIDGAVPGYPRLTEAGFDTMRNDLKIRTDLDFRTREQAGSESVLGSHINQVVVPISGYTRAFNSKDGYATIMRTFADIDNYPIFFHCSGGADRTGTVAMLVEALAGACEADLSIDFEMTTGSGRPRYRYNHSAYYYADTLAQLKTYSGNTLQEKAEDYAMVNLGLKRAEVSNIQSILSGNKVVFKYVNDLKMGRTLSVQLKNYNGQKLSSVTINGKSVEGVSVSNDGILSVNFTETGLGAISFEDGTVLKCNVVEPGTCDVITLDDGFKRIILDEQDGFLSKGETRNFSFDVSKGGNYAFFLNKTNETNGFRATVSNGTNAYTISDDTAANDSYEYDYVRLDTVGKSDSVSLESGTWTLSLTPINDTTLNYIDVRLVSIPVSGTPMAIYPSDYYEYDSISNAFSVNGQMDSEIAKQEGYSYIANYENDLLKEPFSYARPIRIEKGQTVSYKLNALLEGTYKIRIDHGYYSEDTPLEGTKGILNVALGNESIGSFEGNIAQSGVNARNVEEFTIVLASGENTLSFTQAGTAGDIYGITLVKYIDPTSAKCVMVDNNLSRIEISSDHRTVDANETACYEFTVKADGNYSLFADLGKIALDAKVIVENVKTGEFISYYEGTLPFNKYEDYRKLGIGPTEPISLKSGTNYKLYFTPTVAVTAMSFIDVINTNLEVSGKTIVPAYYYKTTTETDRTINVTDQAKVAEPYSSYTIAGDYTSSLLATQSGFAKTNYISPYMKKGAEYTFVLDVKKAGMYKIGASVSYHASSSVPMVSGTKHHFGIEVDTKAFDLNYVEGTDGTGYAPLQLIETPSVYLSEGKHTVTLSNNSSRNYYMIFVCATPNDAVSTTLNTTDKKATVSYGFSESVTGTVITALYSGEELVGVVSESSENSFGGETTVSYTQTPDKVKVFAWDEFSNMTPLRSALTEIKK